MSDWLVKYFQPCFEQVTVKRETTWSPTTTMSNHLEEEGHLTDHSSVLVQQKARERAVLPSAAIDGSTVQPEPHLVSLEQR